ncbi:MAG: hypothetical protein H6819_12275 [Phycisphaerales bacterium]|nr:hypothetical protein [Phycisphaerales bacterium]MCB9857523.1 hypothetical protein [Phycisphaerales bacterium]MCB9864492.1 hypothetical protein [Phycisphaerales bacterium]
MADEAAVENSKVKRRARWPRRIAVCLTAILIAGYSCRYDLAYRWLGLEHDLRFNSSLGTWIKQTLAQDRSELIRMAQRVNICQGAGLGLDWQTRALVDAPSFPELEETLESSASSPSARVQQRTGANRVLFRRTRDPKYVLRWFKLVKEPGDIEISAGRRGLAWEFHDEALRSVLDRPRSTVIPISEEAFERLIKDGSALDKRELWRDDIRE